MTEVEEILSVLFARIEDTKHELPIESYVRRPSGRVLRVVVEETAEATVRLETEPIPIVGARVEALNITLAAAAGDAVVNIWNDPTHRSPEGPASYIVNDPPGKPCACCKGSGVHQSDRSTVYRIPTAEASSQD